MARSPGSARSVHRGLLRAIFSLGVVAAAWSAEPVAKTTEPLRPPSLIPVPVELSVGASVGFTLTPETRVVLLKAPAEAGRVVDFLRGLAKPSTGAELPVVPGDLSTENAIVFNFDRAGLPAALRDSTSPEAYALTVDARRVVIQAVTAEGAFRAVQTLRQLLPPEMERRSLVTGVTWTAPAVTIRDEPRYPWRGLLLDVGRTFFTVDEVKRFLDLMALHKFNVLHWHLTDDQGWRIEIKQYPRLTQVGAWRAESPLRTDRKRGDGLRYGGFYTQDEIRDVVAYATARFITVLPEIDLPGHSAAAIAAYPELGNDDIPNYAPQVMTRWGVHPYTYAPKEETFVFIEKVLGEVISLFPGRYVHIGGDEAPKTQWQASPFAQAYMKQHELKDEHELQSHFITRVGRYLAANNRQLIGWDEIQEGGTPQGAAVMLWRTNPPKGAPKGTDVGWQNLWAPLKAGHQIVLTPNSHFYLDHYQADPKTSAEPYAIGGLDPLPHVYGFEPPSNELTAEESKRILGIEANLWSEYIWDFPKLEYMAFPRASAVAEVGWSPKEKRDFAQFETRLAPLLRRLDELGVLYRKPGTVPRQAIQ